MNLVMINGQSLDEVQSSTYKMESVDVFDKWTDANHIDHRHIYRQKVKGSFEMVFLETERHLDFLDIIDENKSVEGWIPMTVYLPAKAMYIEINAFITMNSVKQVDMNNGYVVDRISIAVEEA